LGDEQLDRKIEAYSVLNYCYLDIMAIVTAGEDNPMAIIQKS